MTIDIRRLNSEQADFSEQMDALLAWEAVSDHQVQSIVTDILVK